MRQSGIIAAGALYALEHHIERLADDHRAAQILADAVRATPQLALEPDQVDTNIVIFRTNTPGGAAAFCQQAHAAGVWMLPFSRIHVRAVTHLHIGADDARRAGEIISATAEKLGRHAATTSL